MPVTTLKEPLNVTEARKVLGNLIDAAFDTCEPVLIHRGTRFVRLVPVQLPEPIEVYPKGAISISKERAAWHAGIEQEPMSPIFR